MSATAAAPAPPASRKTPVHLWIVGGVSLVWNAFGAFDYVATQTRFAPYMDSFSPEQLAYFYGLPAWTVAAWAVGVWAAVAGSAGLLLRRAWARWAFALSLAGMAGSSLYTLVLSDGLTLMGPEAAAFSAVIWLVALLLLAYAAWARRRGVLQ